MEIRFLQQEELANAAGLSRYVFDTCLRQRMEFVQTIPFVENYITEQNIKQMFVENKLKIWGAFEQGQLVGVAGLQSDGMITMLYVLPQFFNRKIGNKLLITMREYAKEVFGFERVSVNATPAWTAFYFAKQGFYFMNPNANMRLPFVTLYALSDQIRFSKKEKITGKTIALAIVAALGFATIVACAFMISYLF